MTRKLTSECLLVTALNSTVLIPFLFKATQDCERAKKRTTVLLSKPVFKRRPAFKTAKHQQIISFRGKNSKKKQKFLFKSTASW